jgi:hypothetical protein
MAPAGGNDALEPEPSPTAPSMPAPTGGIGMNPMGGMLGGALLIDDLEDGDEVIATVDGRDGEWFMFNDGRVTQNFEIDTSCNRAPGNTTCAHSTANQVPEYAGFGFALYADESPFDASDYRGVRFYGRNGQAGAVTISIVTAASAAATGVPGFEATVTMSGNWQQHQVTFGQLNLASWYSGPPVAFSSDELVKVQFMTGGGSSHDISVDDVEFY